MYILVFYFNKATIHIQHNVDNPIFTIYFRYDYASMGQQKDDWYYHRSSCNSNNFIFSLPKKIFFSYDAKFITNTLK